MKLLVKAGINPSALDGKGLSALDVCLVEMANHQGSEIDSWFKIGLFLAQRAICRSKFTLALLKIQKDPRIFKQDRIFTIGFFTENLFPFNVNFNLVIF